MVMEIMVPRDGRSLSLDEFITRIDKQGYDMNDPASLVDIAPDFRRLANNKTFFSELMFDELEKTIEFQGQNLYGPTVFILHSCPNYFIRANIWKPISQVERTIEQFRYDICHDHNFDILTVGYFGPGYRSRVYRYDASEVEGVLGERVTMIPEGEITLEEGRVLLYRAKRDIHIQLPPPSLSVSLNLIPRNDSIQMPQFQFDEETRTICRYLQNSGAELVVRLAGMVGGDRVPDALDRIRRTHPAPHVRALAAVSHFMLVPAERDGIRRWLETSGGARERSIFEKEVELPGACLRLHQTISS